MKHVDVLEQTVDAWLSQRKTLTTQIFHKLRIFVVPTLKSAFFFDTKSTILGINTSPEKTIFKMIFRICTPPTYPTFSRNSSSAAMRTRFHRSHLKVEPWEGPLTFVPFLWMKKGIWGKCFRGRIARGTNSQGYPHCFCK